MTNWLRLMLAIVAVPILVLAGFGVFIVAVGLEEARSTAFFETHPHQKCRTIAGGMIPVCQEKR